MSARRRRFIVLGVVVLSVWFVLSVVATVRPQADAVPVGTDHTAEPARLVSVEVACNGPFDSPARADGPLPVLTPQPAGRPPLEFQRPPCELVQRNARLLLGVDVAFFVLVLGGGALLLSKRRAMGLALGRADAAQASA
jgi:hypothetical protein